MYAHVSQVQLQPGLGDEGPRAWRETILPRLKQQPGFKGLLLMRDRAQDRGMSILLWESEDAAKAAMTESFVAEMQATTQRFRAGPPAIAGYEVMIREDV